MSNVTTDSGIPIKPVYRAEDAGEVQPDPGVFGTAAGGARQCCRERGAGGSAAGGGGQRDVLEPMKEALGRLATVGEVCGVLREVWGEYRPEVRL